MINSVTLKNFRRFHDATIPLSKITLLTGTNGVGKTSVLEGLYCLFSDTRLDVSRLGRYNLKIGLTVDPAGIQGIHTYDYKLFWDECPVYGQQSCIVSAIDENDVMWEWNYSKTTMADLDKSILHEAKGIPIDSSMDIAVFNWTRKKNSPKGINRYANNESVSRAQILNPDCRLYLTPAKNFPPSKCLFLDFASLRVSPNELSYQTAKKLTSALKIINPHVIDVRISSVNKGLSVVLDDENETTLDTLGNGVVAWASTLIYIFNLVERLQSAKRIGVPVFILVDELGAGIHYSVMSELWKYMYDFVMGHADIQLIATTHSDDCVRAFCDLSADKEAISIVRLHKSVDGQIVPTKYTGTHFNSIMSGEWEVRG